MESVYELIDRARRGCLFCKVMEREDIIRLPELSPCSEAVLSSGANITVAELGAIPRDNKFTESEWRMFTAERGRTLLENAGYTVNA